MGIAQCNNKKILNVTKIEIDAMLVLLNKTMKPSNVKKKRSHVILKLHNVKLEPLNVRKKKREPPNVIKKLSHMTKELSHVTKKEQMRCWYCLI